MKKNRQKVRDLIKSRSGVYHEAAAETSEMADARPARGSHPPDTFFYYNNWDFNVAGTIFLQETGEDIFRAFKDGIADLVGMQDFRLYNCKYEYESDKSEHPAYTFRMSARDMARFGVLYQNNGAWEGKQIIPVDWIFESTVAYSTLDTSMGLLGYGYMWGVAPEESDIAELLGYDFYFHSGIDVHALVIVPDLHLVIVERYDTDVPEWENPGDVGIVQRIIEAKL
jgi:CubicO group peptidase (beta-lactamase class C family)